MDDYNDYHEHDFYNHPPDGDEAATVIFEQQKEALRQQIRTLEDQIRVTTDPDLLGTLNVEYNAAVGLFAITYRDRYRQL
jgi:hypothetical protein